MAVMMTQVVGFLPPTWEVWIEFLAPGVTLDPEPGVGRDLGSEPVDGCFLSVCLPLKLKREKKE